MTNRKHLTSCEADQADGMLITIPTESGDMYLTQNEEGYYHHTLFIDHEDVVITQSREEIVDLYIAHAPCSIMFYKNTDPAYTFVPATASILESRFTDWTTEGKCAWSGHALTGYVAGYREAIKELRKKGILKG